MVQSRRAQNRAWRDWPSRGLVVAGLILIIGAPTGAMALEFSLGDTGITGSIRAHVSAGATMRTEAQSTSLIGKLNLQGQQQFCEDKVPAGSPPGTRAPGINCTTVAGNAAYLALPGYAGSNNDNGDLNYGKGDFVAAAAVISPQFQLTYGNFGLDVSGLFFYDPINANFTEYHSNNLQENNGFQPRNTPRASSAEHEIGRSERLLNAYASDTISILGDRQLTLKVGEQVLSLGTSSVLVLNSLNVVNAPDVNIRNLPGAELKQLFQRSPLAVAELNITEDLTFQTFYEFGWQKAQLPPIGSFFSTNDILGAGTPYASVLFGKYREDPMNLVGAEERTQGNAYLLSSAGRTIYAAPDKTPSSQGQYGVTFTYLAEGFNNTTFGLTYLNLHASFPNISFIASQKGCAHDAANQAEALVDCRGFNGPTHLGVEPLPIDTLKFYDEYPSDIHALGATFSTNLGKVAWTGEFVYRPNQPLQIDPADLGFAALQPVFPAENLNFGVVTFPSRETASPDYVETIYRHNPVIQPLQNIPGYVRLQTMNYDTSFLFLRGASENPFGADQVTTLVELGAFEVFNLPSLNQLQLAAPGTQFHHSAGIDGTGTPTPDQASADPSNRLNPHYQSGGFATSLSYGYRILNQLSYEDVLPGLKVAPQMTFFQDLGGRSPLPTGEFVSGRKQATFGLTFNYETSLSANIRYAWSWGAGVANLASDRDNISASVSYDF